MKDGETRVVGNATVLCNVFRMSWTRREDKWMGRLAPRHTNSRTTYTVVDNATGKATHHGVEGLKNAVKIAEGI